MKIIGVQIEELKTWRDMIANGEQDKCDIKSEIDVINDAISTIQYLSAKLAEANMERSGAYYNGGWIPCGVRLPQEKENPITMDYYEYHVTFECDGMRDVRHYKFGKGHWWNGSENMDRYVTAWRERPEPYKKEV